MEKEYASYLIIGNICRIRVQGKGAARIIKSARIRENGGTRALDMYELVQLEVKHPHLLKGDSHE